MFWLIGILFLLAGLGGYLLRKHEVGRKAAGRDLRRGVPFLAIGLIVGFGLMRLPPYVFDLLLLTAKEFWILFGWFCWILIGYGLWRRRQAGSVLLNLGRSTSHKVLLGSGVLLMLMAIIELVDLLLGAGTELTEVFGPLGMLAFGAFFLFVGWSGVVIREAGIFSSGQFVKWERIESYEWGEKAVMLRLKGWRFKTWIGACGAWKSSTMLPLHSGKLMNIPVPPLHRDAVGDLLAQHVSSADC